MDGMEVCGVAIFDGQKVSVYEMTLSFHNQVCSTWRDLVLRYCHIICLFYRPPIYNFIFY